MFLSLTPACFAYSITLWCFEWKGSGKCLIIVKRKQTNTQCTHWCFSIKYGGKIRIMVLFMIYLIIYIYFYVFNCISIYFHVYYLSIFPTPSVNDVRYFPKKNSPSGNFPRLFSQVETSQMCNFSSGNFPSLS